MLIENACQYHTGFVARAIGGIGCRWKVWMYQGHITPSVEMIPILTLSLRDRNPKLLEWIDE